MATFYSYFQYGLDNQSNRGGGEEQQKMNLAEEDQQWNLVAKKLAFEDRTRAMVDHHHHHQHQHHHQNSKGSSNHLPASKALTSQNSKPMATGRSKAPKSSPSATGKHNNRGTTAHTDMVTTMIDKLLTIDAKSAKSHLPLSQKGILSHDPSLNLPNVLAHTQSTTSPNSPVVDKRFKSLPPAESLPRNETLGGYIFVCNNDTMQEDLKRQLFGLPQRYRDSVRSIQPGLPLFLYNYTTHQLHGVFEAASFGGSNIDPSAWEDKKNKGESRFPAQVRIRVRKICKPLEEDAFRPVLFHYDGPKFRLQLSVPETLALLDLCLENRT